MHVVARAIRKQHVFSGAVCVVHKGGSRRKSGRIRSLPRRSSHQPQTLKQPEADPQPAEKTPGCSCSKSTSNPSHAPPHPRRSHPPRRSNKRGGLVECCTASNVSSACSAKIVVFFTWRSTTTYRSFCVGEVQDVCVWIGNGEWRIVQCEGEEVLVPGLAIPYPHAFPPIPRENISTPFLSLFCFLSLRFLTLGYPAFLFDRS